MGIDHSLQPVLQVKEPLRLHMFQIDNLPVGIFQFGQGSLARVEYGSRVFGSGLALEDHPLDPLYRQSGLAFLNLADIYRDQSVLQEAYQAVRIILESDPQLEKDENLPLQLRLHFYIRQQNDDIFL